MSSRGLEGLEVAIKTRDAKEIASSRLSSAEAESFAGNSDCSASSRVSLRGDPRSLQVVTLLSWSISDVKDMSLCVSRGRATAVGSGGGSGSGTKVVPCVRGVPASASRCRHRIRDHGQDPHSSGVEGSVRSV